MMFSLTSVESHHISDLVPNEEQIEEDSLFQDYMNIGKRLQDQNLISIDAATFAAASITVHYSESNLNPKANYDNQTGIFQITKSTRQLLNIPELSNLTRKEQLVYYEQYLRACSSKALLKVKNSIDLHILHFAPSRTNKIILSQVTNKGLRGLDRNKDNVITREDLRLFEKDQLKYSQQISHIYDQFFKNSI